MHTGEHALLGGVFLLRTGCIAKGYFMDLILFGVTVRIDKDGRYCINDLHKAAGGNRKDDPADWMRLKQTKSLAEVIVKENTGIPVVSVGGRNGGTFACKEMVYSYAMWISAEFNLRVIRTFDEYASGRNAQIAVRNEARLEYRPMTDAIKSERELAGKDIKPHHFSNEADLINRIALGMTAAKFRAHHELKKDVSIRDYLTPEQIRCVVSLQRANTVYIEAGMVFEDRKVKLRELYERNHYAKLMAEVQLIEA